MRRTYSAVPCSTLLVSFCSLTEANSCQFEWVGAAKRMEMTHTLFLTDPLQSWYLRSNANMDVDPFAATLAIVTAEIEELGPTRVICIGSSMGGYAATRCALALGTLEDKCLPTVASIAAVVFGPQIFINPLERVALHLPWMSFDDALDRLQRVAGARKFGFPLSSLVHIASAVGPTHPRPQSEATATGSVAARVQIALHVGSAASGDVREARLFEAAVAMLTESLASQTPSLAPRVCVEVCVHDTIGESDGHCVAASLKAAGRLDAILSPYLCAL